MAILPRKYLLGLGLLLIVVLIWTISSYVVQDILSSDNCPFFLTYFANSLFLIQLPIVLCDRYWNRLDPYAATASPDYTVLESISGGAIIVRAPRAPCKEYIKGMYDWPTLRAALIVTPLWFAANGLYNLSLAHTSVTSNTVISSTSGMFTYTIAVTARQEGFSWWKVLGVIFSIGGTTMTSIADAAPSSLLVPAPSSAPSPSSSLSVDTTGVVSNSLLGDFICLLAALFYGLYTTAIHRYLPSIDKTNLFFGYLGALGFVLFTPVVLILNATKIEDLSLLSSRALVLIACKGLFDNVLSDTLWAIAMKWTSPTVATLALALTIPTAIVGAMLLGRDSPTILATCGAMMMLVGFGCVVVAGSRSTQENDQAEDSGRNADVNPTVNVDEL